MSLKTIKKKKGKTLPGRENDGGGKRGERGRKAGRGRELRGNEGQRGEMREVEGKWEPRGNVGD